MSHRETVFIASFVAVLLASTGAHAQDDSEESGRVGLQITSCVVFSVNSPGTTYDCLAEAKKAAAACAKMEACEIPIGYNLTSGNDIDPGAGFVGKQVKITYKCGEVPQQGGPYNQSDHASLVLNCSGMWW